MGNAIAKRILLVAASVLLLPFMAQTAHADNVVDFSCGGLNSCTGTLTISGSTYSATGAGIGGLVEGPAGSPDAGDTFNLTFDTSAGTISLTDGTDTLSGSIVSSATLPDILSLNVDWTSLPTAFQTYLGATSGSGAGSVIYINTSGSDAAESADFDVTPTPEPSSSLLLGVGLLALCGLIRRKAVNVV
jgi:hypothetical protein